MYDTQLEEGRVFNSINRTCERLDVGKTSVYEMIAAGELEAVKQGTKRLVTERSIQALFKKRLAEVRLEVA